MHLVRPISTPQLGIFIDISLLDPYKTEYRAERFYPDYYDAPRPNVTGIPASISYGGDGFDLTLPSTSLNGSSLDNIFIGLMRTGFSTHAMNMGMKYVELQVCPSVFLLTFQLITFSS